VSEHSDRSGMISRRQFLKMAGAAGATVCLAGGLGGLVAACGDEKTTTTTTTGTATQGNILRIGVLVAMTNWYSAMDMSEFEETQACADLLNEQGITIGGKNYTIELVPEDIKSSLDGTTAASTKLCYDDKVKFLIGPAAFFTSAASPTCEAAGVMHVSSYCTLTPPEVGPSTPLGFVGTNSIAGAIIAQVQAFRKLFPDAKTILDISPDDGAIPYLMPVFTKTAEKYGFTPSPDCIGYPNEMADFSPIAQKVNAQNVDVAFHCNGTPTMAANIMKVLRGSGNMKPYGGNIGCSPEDLVKVCGKDMATEFLSTAQNPKNPDNFPFAQKLMDSLLERWGESRTISFHHAQSLYTLVDCIKKAGTLEPTEVAKTWEAGGTLETLWGPGNIGGTETYGIKNHAIGMPQQYNYIVNGEVVENGTTMDVVIP
jgi:ABC-type branched-subunit amino acid transport system substrate-binding protein